MFLEENFGNHDFAEIACPWSHNCTQDMYNHEQ